MSDINNSEMDKYKRYRLRHPEKVRAYQNKYNSRPEVKTRHKKWQQENRDKVIAATRKWQKANPEYMKAYKKEDGLKKIRFKDKRIKLKENPRKGECSVCHRKIGEGIKLTLMHHVEYHEDDPLKDTIELCIGCHNIVHQKIQKINENRRASRSPSGSDHDLSLPL